MPGIGVIILITAASDSMQAIATVCMTHILLWVSIHIPPQVSPKSILSTMMDHKSMSPDSTIFSALDPSKHTRISQTFQRYFSRN